MYRIEFDSSVSLLARERAKTMAGAFHAAESSLGVVPTSLMVTQDVRALRAQIMGEPLDRQHLNGLSVGQSFEKDGCFYVILSSALFDDGAMYPALHVYNHELSHRLYDELDSKKMSGNLQFLNMLLVNEFVTEQCALKASFDLIDYDVLFPEKYERIYCSSMGDEYGLPCNPFTNALLCGATNRDRILNIVGVVREQVCAVAYSYVTNRVNRQKDWIPPRLREYFDEINKKNPRTLGEAKELSVYLQTYFVSAGLPI